jgi:hypothetical protein
MESPENAHLAPIPAQENGAIIEGAYRYLLWRTWDVSLPSALWILLNPSMADERIDDRTLRRCKAFTASWRFGGLEIVNLFALRTPYPRDLYQATDPVGEENDRHIIAAARRATYIILAWGAHGTYRERDQAVLALLKTHTALTFYCLGITQSGSPRHPLYRTKQTAISLCPQLAIDSCLAP